jgi:hypothetical protein
MQNKRNAMRELAWKKRHAPVCPFVMWPSRKEEECGNMFSSMFITKMRPTKVSKRKTWALPISSYNFHGERLHWSTITHYTQTGKFTSCLVQIQNFVSHTEGRT